MSFSEVEHAYWHNNALVALIHDVPSWVCQLCGHRYLEPAVEATLRQIAKDYLKLGNTFPIPTTSYRSQDYLRQN
jgi:YgiT-type zinc finger domain-containing protein